MTHPILHKPLESLLAERQIIAPYDGVILRVNIREGQSVEGYTTAFDLGDPNDLVVRNVEGGVTRSFRKVGGVLAEAGDGGGAGAWLIVGLGLNVRGDLARLDPVLAATATRSGSVSGRSARRYTPRDTSTSAPASRAA